MFTQKGCCGHSRDVPGSSPTPGDRRQGLGNTAHLWPAPPTDSTPMPRWEDLGENEERIGENEVFPLATMWMHLEDVMPSELSQKNKYRRISLLCGI